MILHHLQQKIQKEYTFQFQRLLPIEQTKVYDLAQAATLKLTLLRVLRICDLCCESTSKQDYVTAINQYMAITRNLRVLLWIITDLVIVI
jgi:hypothetical protein